MINKTLTLQEKYKIALQIREIENEKLKLKSVSKRRIVFFTASWKKL